MTDYRNNDRETVVVRKSNTGTIIAVVLVAALVIVGLLFATGFWSAETKSGSLPEVSVKGGSLPKVDLDSKEVVVGTTETKVEVPKVKTETETVSVPTVGVNDNGEK